MVDNNQKGKCYVRITFVDSTKKVLQSYLPITNVRLLLRTIDDTYTKRFSACMMVDNKQKGKCEVKIVLYMSKV